MKSIIAILLIFLSTSLVFSSSDELLKQLENSTPSEKIKLIDSIINNSVGMRTDSISPFDSSMIKMIQILPNHEKQLGLFHHKKGNFLIQFGDYELIKKLYLKADTLFKAINDTASMANLYNSMGIIYSDIGQYEEALKYYHLSYKLQGELGNIKGQVNTAVNLGIVYAEFGDLEKSKEHFLFALDGHKLSNDSVGMGNSYNNLSIIYHRSQEFDTEKFYLDSALTIWRIIDSKQGIAMTLNNFGTFYKDQKMYEKAIPYYEESYQICFEINNTYGIAQNLKTLMDLYYKSDNLSKALSYGKKGVELHKKMGVLPELMEDYEVMYKIYAKKQDFKKAFDYKTLHDELKDSIASVDIRKKVTELEGKFETVKKEKKIELLNIENELQLSEIDKQNQLKLVYLSGFILMIIISIYVFKNYRDKQKVNEIISSQKEDLEETNEELNQTNEELASQRDEIENQKNKVEEAHQQIKDSIIYAKRIQNAILPAQSIIKESLPHSFVLYKPKDVVAGDFYWLEQLENATLFAAADCTGHGVPGAMVSVVCNNAMNRAVREFGLTEPGLILDKTRELVITEFEKSEDDVKDGMDIALCMLEGNKLKYAGAHNPLCIVRDSELLETKGNKQPIGKFDSPTPFTTHTFELQKGDSIYIFTDGYADQFGGDKDKKFGSNRLKDLILSIQEKSMVEQKNILESTLENWIFKANTEQIDDICIIGVKLN